MGRILSAVVRRAGDATLERTAGSDRGLALLFGALARRFDPAGAAGFRGDVRWDLRTRDGRLKRWTLAVRERSADARAGAGPAPALVVKLGLADLVRLAAGELDAGRALLDGRLDLEGDTDVAMRLGPMFRIGSPL